MSDSTETKVQIQQKRLEDGTEGLLVGNYFLEVHYQEMGWKLKLFNSLEANREALTGWCRIRDISELRGKTRNSKAFRSELMKQYEDQLEGIVERVIIELEKVEFQERLGRIERAKDDVQLNVPQDKIDEEMNRILASPNQLVARARASLSGNRTKMNHRFKMITISPLRRTIRQLSRGASRMILSFSRAS